MRIRCTTWSVVVVLLLCGAAAGYGARLPRNSAQGSSEATTAKVAPTKPPAARVHTTKTSAKRRVTHARVAHERQQMAPTAARISEIQSALATQGAFQSEPNGRWDAATADAMKQFQSAHGLNPSGKIDALTLQKLGLGSQVAGMGAPLPLSVPQASAKGSSDPTEHP